MLITGDTVSDHVREELGYPIVNVELTDGHIQHAVTEALMLFNRYLGEAQMAVYYSRIGSTVIDLPSGTRGVCEVKAFFPENERIYGQMNVFEILYRMVYPQLPIGEWYMLRSFYEMYQRIRGSEPDWIYSGSEKKLYVDTHSGPYEVYVVFIADAELDSFNSAFQDHQRLFLNIVLAYAKQVLAKIRGKFGGSIPVPGGSLVTDAEILRSEAAETLLKAEEDLDREAGLSCPVIWGA